MARWVSVRFISSNTTNDQFQKATPARMRALLGPRKSGCQAQQAPKRGRHRLATHRFAIPVEVEDFGRRVAPAPLPADPDGADGFVCGSAGRPGDAGDG